MDDPAGRPSPMADRIYQDLAGRIVRGELAPGTRLPGERVLAETYGTNRNTLREGIRRLEQARLLRIRHGRRAVVTDFRTEATVDVLGPYFRHALDPEEAIATLTDVMFARRRLLEETGALAVERATASDLQRIEVEVASQIAALGAGDRASLVRGELRIMDALVDASHSLIFRWTANTLFEVYEGFLDGAEGFWSVGPEYAVYLPELVRTLRARDVEAARDATRVYFETSDARLLELLDALMALRDP